MKIKFHSTITMNEKTNDISFDSDVIISKFNDFDVYEFSEPNNNIQNRIEVSSSQINIFSGPSSLFLVLNKEINVEYQLPNGSTVYFISFLKSLARTATEIVFDYTLSDLKNNLLGNYKITLTLSE
ncbi:hypothetical protein ACW95P_03060 [Candidatus Mycoplasma pogonae]